LGIVVALVLILKQLMQSFRVIGRRSVDGAKWWAEWAQRTLARSAAAFVHYFILVAIHRFIPVYITLLLVQDVDGCSTVARQFVQRLHRDVRQRRGKVAGEKGRLENYFELEAKVRSVNGNLLPFIYVITHVVFYVMLDYWHFEPKTTSLWVPYVLRHVVSCSPDICFVMLTRSLAHHYIDTIGAIIWSLVSRLANGSM
jgi:hypothetical protein